MRADTSVDTVIAAGYRSSSTIGRLPSVRHDTAAAVLGGNVYVFGGGNGASQLDDIVRVDPSSGHTTVVAHLPAASSDSTAAAIGGTAYVVGGYTGTRWLDTIVAWRPGAPPRIVAHLPKTLRYAAVTAVGKTLVIAGGSLENGTAERQRACFHPGDAPRHADRHPPRPDHARRGSDARQRRLRDRRPRRDDRNADDRDRRRRRRPQAGARRGAPEDRRAPTWPPPTLGARIIVVGGKADRPAPSRPSRGSRRSHGH